MRNLFTTWYDCGNEQRQKELDHCLKTNVESGLFDNVIVVVDQSCVHENEDGTKKVMCPVKKHEQCNVYVHLLREKKKPSYSEFISAMELFVDFNNENINIIANTDIIFDETIKLADNMGVDDCYTLSRWEMETFEQRLHYQVQVYGDSQDVWIFKGNIKPMEFTDFKIGSRGVDNRIAHEIQKAGYKITNPSKSIKTWHLHLSNVRDYIPAQGYAVPEPYLNVPLTAL